MKRFLILSALQPILMELATGGMGKHKANEGKGARTKRGIGRDRTVLACAGNENDPTEYICWFDGLFPRYIQI